MGNWEPQYLVKEKTYSSDSDTLYIDLPKGEQIGMLMLELSASRTSTVNLLGTILDVATKIDVMLNGSKLAFGCEPEVASFFYYLATQKLPPHQLSQRGTTLMRLPILFGRYLGDEEYLLDMANYKNAQIQIPYSLNTSYYTTGTTKLTAWYLRPSKPLSPVGFIRQRTVKSETSTGTAGDIDHLLPLEYPVLDVGFRAYDIDQFLINDVTDVKFDINSNKETPFDGRIEDLLMLQELMFGKENGYLQWMRPKDGDTVATQIGHVEFEGFWGTSASAWADTINCSAHWGPQATLSIKQHDGTARSVAGDWWVRFAGLAPHNCLSLLHTKPTEPFPLNEKSEAKIFYTMGAYAAYLQTFIREVVKGVLG